jgi:hypothetical protein
MDVGPTSVLIFRSSTGGRKPAVERDVRFKGDCPGRIRAERQVRSLGARSFVGQNAPNDSGDGDIRYIGKAERASGRRVAHIQRAIAACDKLFRRSVRNYTILTTNY